MVIPSFKSVIAIINHCQGYSLHRNNNICLIIRSNHLSFPILHHFRFIHLYFWFYFCLYHHFYLYLYLSFNLHYFQLFYYIDVPHYDYLKFMFISLSVLFILLIFTF